MKSAIYTIALLLMCLGSYVTASGVSKCWSCSDTSCNDPFDSNNANIVNCSDSNYRSSGFTEGNDEADMLFKKFNSLSSSTTDNVCIKYHVTSKITLNHDFTVRLCSPRKVGTENICDVITKTIGASIGPVDNCKACDSDLCNSASKWKVSILAALVFVSLGFILQ